MFRLNRTLAGFPRVIELPTYDFPDYFLRHYLDTGISPPKTFSGDLDRTLTRVVESQAAGITHSVLFPASLNTGQLATALRGFSKHVIQA